MNGRELATGEVETWPDNEKAQNVLFRLDGSFSQFEDGKPFMVSGKVEQAGPFKRIRLTGDEP